MKEKDSQMDAPPDKIQELTPFTHRVMGGTYKIAVESQGKNPGGTDRGKRYYFNHPWKKDKNGRALKIHSQSADIIKSLLEAAVKDAFQDSVTLTPEEFAAYEDDRKLRFRLERQLEGTDLTLDTAIGQIAPTLKLLIPEQVTLARALEDGRSFHVPAHPMNPEDIIDGLIPLIAHDSTERYAKNLDSTCEPLRIRFHGQPIHRVRPQDLERLLRDVEEGKFLNEEEKKRSLARMGRTTPLLKLGREKWYSDKSLVHYFNGWRRIFVRGKALGAWPLLRPIPTEVMEQPKADLAELDALSAEDWEILMPALNRDELRLVALLISDIRPAEIERLKPHHIHPATGMPESVDIPPRHTKGKKGKKKGRIATLLPNASVILFMARAEGEELFSCSVNDLMAVIYAKARELGIEPTHNCIRRMHDTYWYGLVKAKSAYNKDSSHSPAMIEKIYRSMASFEDCVRVFRTLPPGTPAHLRCWVLDWLDGFVQHVRGKGVPKPGEEAAQAEPTADRLPSDVMPAETDDDHDEGEQDSDFLDLPVIPPLHTEPPRPIEEGNGLKGSENVIVLDAQPNPIAQGTTTPQSTPASLSSVHGNESPEQPTGTEANQLILAGTVPKSPDQALLPKPARLPDGRIHWKNMSEVVLDNLFSNYTAPQIAGAWGIHVTGVYVKIRKWQKSAVLAGANGMAPASGLGTKKPAPRSTIPWPASKADFLQEIWDVPATKICLRLGCSQASVIMKAAELGFPRPGYGYFQKKNSGIDMAMTAEAKELLLRLRAEEAAQKGSVNSPIPHPADGPSPASSPMAGSGAKAPAPAEAKAHAAAPEIHDEATVTAPPSPTVGPASSNTAQPAAPPAPASDGSSPAI